MQKTTFVQHGRIQWIDIVEPDEQALKQLKKKYGFHALDLEDCLSEHQRSKIDEYDNYLFIVLHFPHYDKKRRRIVAEEIDCFIGQNYLITLHDGNLETLTKLAHKLKRKNKNTLDEYLGKGTGYFLYLIIRELFDDSFLLVDELEKDVNLIEKDLFDEDTEKDRFREILWLKKDVINFRLIIAPQRAVIAQLEHKNKKFLPENLEVYFDDVVDKIEKLWNNLETLREFTETLKDTNEILVSHQTNRVIKILTVFSVVLMPLTLITGFYGMNVALPNANQEAVVFKIILFMVAMTLVMLGFFKWRRWI